MRVTVVEWSQDIGLLCILTLLLLLLCSNAHSRKSTTNCL